MNKEFIVNVPDEPYKNEFTQNKTITCLYKGHRFLAVCVDSITGRVHYVARTSNESVTELDIENLKYKDENAVFIAVDLLQNIIVGAMFYPENVTHDEIPAYEEIINENYTYTYNFTNIMNEYDKTSLKYINNAWTTPKIIPYKGPSRETYNANIQTHLEQVTEVINTRADWYTDEDLVKLQNFKSWLQTAATVYENVDLWKIDWPSNVPSFTM